MLAGTRQAAAILGIGTALPPDLVQSPAAIEVTKRYCCGSVKQESIVGHLHRRVGIETRASVMAGHFSEMPGSFFLPPDNCNDAGPTTGQRMAIYRQEVVPLALAAAKNALSNARLPAQQISHLITVSCTGFSAPGLDIALIKQLGLPASTARTNVGFMGCHGAMNALRLAQSIATSDFDSRILIVACELCSIHFQYGWDSHNLLANALFADGAASVVIGGSDSSVWRVSSAACQLIPDSEDAMTWTVGDNGFTMTLSSRIPELIGRHLSDFVESWLDNNQLKISAINSWAIHPGGPRILSAVQKTLNLSDAQMLESRRILADCGNMSSPTLLFILQALQESGAKPPCIMLGFGPGLMVEAALLV